MNSHLTSELSIKKRSLQICTYLTKIVAQAVVLLFSLSGVGLALQENKNKKLSVPMLHSNIASRQIYPQ